jgi:hypothetical protein
MHAATHTRFVGPLDRDDATAILQGHPDGAFCVRESKARMGEFALAMKYDGHVRHLKIEMTSDVSVCHAGLGFRACCVGTMCLSVVTMSVVCRANVTRV